MKEEIVNKLKSIKTGISLIEINDLLDLKSPEDYKLLQDEVNNLVKEGIIHETKKGTFILLENCTSLKVGKISINKSGNGFLLQPEKDIFIDRDNLNDAINGDKVLVDVFHVNNKPEGKVIKILERDLNNIVGEIAFKHKKMIFIPDDPKLGIDITLSRETTKNCVEGHKVLLKIRRLINKNNYLADVIKILGHKNDPGVDIISIACKHGIEIEFNEDVKKELENIPNEVLEEELKGRRNLTENIIFTIDGKDTKDIDDAISLEEKNGNYLLGVHIADVSHYVRPNTNLYETAYERGTSSYLADTVIPMIPHTLSNGICSLNENVIRLTLTCEMEINHQGKVVNYDIYESYIKSNKKMTYADVNKILMENIIPEGYENYSDILIKMNELAKILRKEKISRGYINFDLDEAKIIQDESGKCIDVIKRERYDGENLIEDFMIAANETIAQHIYNMDLPFIYRIHDIPNSEKIDSFMNLIHSLGYKLNTSTISLNSKSMQNILKELEDKKEKDILSDMLLRSMKKAIYTTNNIGHFGLGSKAYTHFTSPIRRFPDLTVHNLLRTYLFKNDLSKETIDFYNSYLIPLAEHSSEKEQNAVSAERDVDDMKMAEYMEDKIGTIYKGIICTITNFGFFVRLPNLIEGLVHINSLKGNFSYIEETLSLESPNKKYRLGDEISVILVSANKEMGTIDFEVYENGNKE